MQVQLGAFVVPDASDPGHTVAQIVAAEESGLDLIGVQDHPYQHRFLDTWTLLSYAAARTERIRLVPDVANLPLRLPAMLAKSAASLDLLSGGRVELGLGAGTFWERVAGLGGPHRAPGEAVGALEEAITVIRAFWSGERGVSVEGRHYRLEDATPGPQAAHRIGIWLGAYRPRMLRLTGRAADGWLPSLGFLDLGAAREAHRAIDEAARGAGRDPSDVTRALNVVRDPEEDLLVRLCADERFEVLVLGVPDEGDPVEGVRRLGELAERVRERLAR